MSQLTHLPELDYAARTLSSLYGVDITAEECSEFDTSKMVVFADYTDDNNETSHFIACDLASAAILGAALTGFMPPMVKEAIQSGTLPENLFANLEEVLNISVSLFPQSSTHRIVLDKVFRDAEAVAAYEGCAGTPEIRFTIELPRYGQGTMIIGAT